MMKVKSFDGFESAYEGVARDNAAAARAMESVSWPRVADGGEMRMVDWGDVVYARCTVDTEIPQGLDLDTEVEMVLPVEVRGFVVQYDADEMLLPTVTVCGHVVGKHFEGDAVSRASMPLFGWRLAR